MSDNDIKMLIRNRRVELGLTMKDVAKAVGVSEGTVSRWESGNISNMRRDRLFALSRVLHLSVDDLMGWKEETSAFTRSSAVRIPVLGRVVAGIPLEAVEEILDWEEIPQAMADSGSYFALQVKGDSMEPKISDGDVVIVRQQEDVESGEVAIVLVNGEDATVKKIKKTSGGIQLLPTNPTYDPIFYTAEEAETLPVRIIGKVVELRAKF